jgi:hypothetical protein
MIFAILHNYRLWCYKSVLAEKQLMQVSTLQNRNKFPFIFLCTHTHTHTHTHTCRKLLNSRILYLDLAYITILQHPVALRRTGFSYRYTEKVHQKFGLYCVFHTILLVKKKKKLHGLSPRANYNRPSDRRFSAKCCQLVRIEGATWSA